MVRTFAKSGPISASGRSSRVSSLATTCAFASPRTIWQKPHSLLDRRGMHRGDVRQVLRDPRPALAFVPARPDVAVRGPEVQAHRIETVVVHAFAQRLHRRAGGETFVQSLPALALVACAIDPD